MRSLNKHDIPKDHSHIINKTYGKWTVIKLIDIAPKSGNFRYLCKCVCGNEKVVYGTKLRTGDTTQCKSCGNRQRGKKGLYAQSKQNLYIVKVGPYIKIGSTDNIKQRIKYLEGQCPFPIELVYHGVGEGREEEMWHDIFKHRHHRGEWFLVGEV